MFCRSLCWLWASKCLLAWNLLSCRKPINFLVSASKIFLPAGFLGSLWYIYLLSFIRIVEMWQCWTKQKKIINICRSMRISRILCFRESLFLRKDCHRDSQKLITIENLQRPNKKLSQSNWNLLQLCNFLSIWVGVLP